MPPSFNDIRLILNSAQILGITKDGPLELVTFDGDVTLYPDGHCLDEDNPVIPKILDLMSRGTKVAIVTAAGYTECSQYYHRLFGLLDRLLNAARSKKWKNHDLIIMGGESSYLFQFDPSAEYLLRYVDRQQWMLPQMAGWTDENIKVLLDIAEKALCDCISSLRLPAQILRKERAVGIIPRKTIGSRGFTREQLEETVLVTQQVIEMSTIAAKVPFCAFNGICNSIAFTIL